jgi:dihydroorotase
VLDRSLKPGSIGDATILSVQQGKFDYVEVVGENMVGDKRIVSEGVVIARSIIIQIS